MPYAKKALDGSWAYFLEVIATVFEFQSLVTPKGV